METKFTMFRKIELQTETFYESTLEANIGGEKFLVGVGTASNGPGSLAMYVRRDLRSTLMRNIEERLFSHD